MLCPFLLCCKIQLTQYLFQRIIAFQQISQWWAIKKKKKKHPPVQHDRTLQLQEWQDLLESDPPDTTQEPDP